MKLHINAMLAGIVVSVTQTPALFAAENNQVIVTANRSAESADQSLASVTVITRKDIEQSQAQDMLELLRLQAGIDVARTGGPSTTTSVFMRGTNSDHTLVLIDGVRASSATTGSFAWQHLQVADIERIEIVRGPRAAQYGSDAIGGVIQVFTRKNHAFQARAQVGSFNTRLLEAGIGGGSIATYSINVSAENSDGFSASNEKNTYSFDPDNDGYRNRSLSASMRAPLSKQTHIDFTGWYNDAYTEYDQGTNDSINGTFNVKLSSQTTSSWSQTVSAGVSEDNIRNKSTYPSQISTKRTMADWQHDITLNPDHLLTLGISTVLDKGRNDNLTSNSNVFDKSIQNNALFAIFQGHEGNHDINFSARVDDHETAGTHNTAQLGWGYDAGKDLRLTASYGTAFKAPSLNQLFNPGYSGYYAGNPDLQPEESATAELGVRYTINRQQHLRISTYQTKIDNLIAYEGINSQAINIAKVHIDGLELEHQYQRDKWRLLTNITFQKAVDEKDNSDLVRRPRRKLSMQLRRLIGKSSNVGLEWLYASKRIDGFPNKDKTLPAYNLVNLSTRLNISKGLWFEGRIENLLNEDYELAYGYNTAKASVYAGIRYAMDK